jgi:hypothetical protein
LKLELGTHSSPPVPTSNASSRCARFRISAKNPELGARRVDYLARFFHELARGTRKHVLPRGLRWLEAPGGQIFHWGELPAYRGQEPIIEIDLPGFGGGYVRSDDGRRPAADAGR